MTADNVNPNANTNANANANRQGVLLTRGALDVLEQSLTLENLTAGLFRGNEYDNVTDENYDDDEDGDNLLAETNNDDDNNVRGEEVARTLGFFTMFAETLTNLQQEAHQEARLDEIEHELLVHLMFLRRLLDEHPRGKKRPYPFDDDGGNDDEEETDQGQAITI